MINRLFTAVTTAAVLSAVCPSVSADTALFPFFRLFSFSDTASLSVPVSQFADGESCALGNLSSARLLFRDAEFRIAWNTPKTDLQALGAGTPAALPALRISTPPALPFTVSAAAGMIGVSGMNSRFTSPGLPEDPSVFSSGCSEPDVLSVRLSSTATVPKPYGAALHTGLSRPAGALRSLAGDFFADDTGICAGGATISWSLPRLTAFGISLCAGRYQIESKTTSWFSHYPLCAAEWRADAAASVFFLAPHFRSVFTVCAFESPFSGTGMTYRGENTLRVGIVTVNAAAFLTDGSEFLRADSSRQKTAAEFRLNPHIRIPLRTPTPSYLQFAVSGETATPTGTAPVLDCTTYRVSFGSAYRSPSTTFSMTGSAGHTPEQEYALCLRLSCHTIPARPAVQLSGALQPEKPSGPGTKESAAATITSPGTQTLVISSSCTLNQTAWAYDGCAAALSAQLMYEKNGVRLSGKLSASFQF